VNTQRGTARPWPIWNACCNGGARTNNQERVMHRLSLGLIPALVLGASVASAAPVSVPGLATLPNAGPANCVALARVPSSALIPGPALAAHVSVANCMAEAAMNALALTNDEASIAKLDGAVASSIELLDNVIRIGDPYWKVVAEDAKRDTYVGMIVRERITIPKGDVIARAALELELAPWQAEAKHATEAIAELSHEQPTLTRRDPMIAGIIGRAGDAHRTGQVAGLSSPR